jgi:hypothetical protein
MASLPAGVFWERTGSCSTSKLNASLGGLDTQSDWRLSGQIVALLHGAVQELRRPLAFFETTSDSREAKVFY